ncbi:MAG: hypothetical protein CVU77_03545 [Elusimicrobia bacterium HGW-Elusimicrobia-1]|jgi:hypothetical protein|nr:MAG: hypothetical protein CVU77_03545 [Elusimicrobia bacterium HGW-Elusimicrobia-1]
MNNRLTDVKYYIDTSALIRTFRFYPQSLIAPIWGKLEAMFKSGQLASHRFVYEEITTAAKSPDILSKSITPLKEYFKTQTYSQTKIVADIISKFPGLIDPNQEKEEADPWLIAIAIMEKIKNIAKDICVVSEESERKPNKIPAVCKHYKIEHLNLERFYLKIGLDFKVIFK